MSKGQNSKKEKGVSKKIEIKVKNENAPLLNKKEALFGDDEINQIVRDQQSSSLGLNIINYSDKNPIYATVPNSKIYFTNNSVKPLSLTEQLVTLGQPISITSASISDQLILQDDINALKKKMTALLKESEVEKADKNKIETEFKELQKELAIKEKINHIVPRICEEGRKLLFSSADFKELFADARSCNAVVVSIDIRRSTELMLKARKPELFAKFITELSQKLSHIIISNFGIFDKFTGDGILAFFPDFYSGHDAMYFALKAANECHEIFRLHYNASRECFNVFIKNAGLGNGVDYGKVTLVNTNNELTVVGIPVVYACRMSGANAGDTILNQPAMEHVEEKYHNQTKITETEINIKNEGVAAAYKVEINEKAVKITNPNWTDLIKEFKQADNIPKAPEKQKSKKSK